MIAISPLLVLGLLKIPDTQYLTSEGGGASTFSVQDANPRSQTHLNEELLKALRYSDKILSTTCTHTHTHTHTQILKAREVKEGPHFLFNTFVSFVVFLASLEVGGIRRIH